MKLNQQRTVDCEARKRNIKKRTNGAKPGGKPLSLIHAQDKFGLKKTRDIVDT